MKTRKQLTADAVAEADSEPRIVMMDWPRATSWGKPANKVPAYLVPLSEAIVTRYKTDAHFQPITSNVARRLNNDAIGKVPIAVVYYVGDVDDPIAHLLEVPARETWRAHEDAKLAKLRKRHPGVLSYGTRGGYRLIFRCAQSFTIAADADREAWWSRYLAFRRYVFARSGIVIDPSCKDFGRLFRFPSVRRDDVESRFPITGDATAIEALDLALFTETKEPPEDGLAKLNKFVGAALKSAGRTVVDAPDGTRNDVLNAEAFSVAGFVPKHLDRDLLRDVMLTAILANGGDEKKDGRKIDEAIEAGMKKPRAIPEAGTPSFSGARARARGAGAAPRAPEGGESPHVHDDGLTADRTDMRNAERLVEWFGADLRYCSSWGKWLAWDGARWQLDDQCRAHAFAKETARKLLSLAIEAQAAANEALAEATAARDDEAKAGAKVLARRATENVAHAIASQNAARIDAMLAVAKSDPAVLVHHDRLDADPFLLNVSNGTIDLRTGDLRPHRREDLCTRLAPVAHDAQAQAPTWERFLAGAMAGNDALVSFLARLIGYALTGDVREHVLVFFHGGGANGKSTFLVTIHTMLGDYATPAPRQLLFRSRGDRHPTELASLHGRRYVTCSEIEEGLAFDEALVKDLTGGDPIEARRMREDFWCFSPSHKLFIAGNHKPQVRGDDNGIWRRMRLVPWTVTISEKDQDKSLPQKLRDELPGILAWAVRGCLAWQAEGLAAPVDVREATAAYRTESDVLGQFLQGRVVFDPSAKVPRAKLRRTYEAYCEENGLEPLGAKRFAGRLREHAVVETTMRVTGHEGKQRVVDAWRGVRLATAEEQEAQLAAQEEAATRRDVGTCSDRSRDDLHARDPDLRTNPDPRPTSHYVPTNGGRR